MDKEIIIRTEKVNELLSPPPDWIYRWGVTLILIVLVLGFGLAYFIKYPDIINGKLTITASNNDSSKNLTTTLVLLPKDILKIKPGQKVNIRLDEYPFSEFGIVNGTVKDFLVNPADNNYIISIELANGLQTSYNKKIPFKAPMLGNGNIMTEEISIIERIKRKLKRD